MCSSGTVLVVDDEPIFRRELAENLKEHSISALTASTSKEAMVHISERGELRVALLDLRLPDGDGIEIAERIQSIRPDIRIIFVSGYDSAEYRARSIERKLRVESWVNKGSDPADLVGRLVDAITRIIDRQALARFRTVLGSVHTRYPFSDEQLQLLGKGLASVFRGVKDADPVIVASAVDLTFSRQPSDIFAVFDEIIAYLDDLIAGHSDPAQRELAWQQLRSLVNKFLWKSIEESNLSLEARQIAIQLKLAINRIASPQLTIDHINGLILCVERMRSERIGASDVSACKRRLRDAGIETLPSFARVVSDWEIYYGIDSAEEKEEANSTRDDDPDPSTRG